MSDTPTEPNAPSPLSCLSLVRFLFEFEAIEALRLPAYAGSAWRGLLGYGLRRAACVTRQPVCDGCLLQSSCVYSTVFEPLESRDLAGRRYSASPHPFVLEVDPFVPRMVASGDRLRLGINLMGQAVDQVPYLIHAMQFAGRHGLGRDRRRFALIGLYREDVLGSERWRQVYNSVSGSYSAPQGAGSAACPQAPTAARIRLLSPLRIKRHNHLVGASEFEAADLLRNLCARLSLLSNLYGENQSVLNWRCLRAAAEEVRLDEIQLRWHQFTRFSSRQNTLMQMDGLCGEFVLHGPGFKTFWPALWIGQWLHVGKGTSFGLGGYRLDPIR